VTPQKTPHAPASPFPTVFWIANVMELFERAAYYGMNSVLAIYLSDSIDKGDLVFPRNRSASCRAHLRTDLRRSDRRGRSPTATDIAVCSSSRSRSSPPATTSAAK